MQLEHRLSVLVQLHLRSRLNTWLQWITQRRLQDETRNILVSGLGAPYIRDFMVCMDSRMDTLPSTFNNEVTNKIEEDTFCIV